MICDLKSPLSAIMNKFLLKRKKETTLRTFQRSKNIIQSLDSFLADAYPSLGEITESIYEEWISKYDDTETMCRAKGFFRAFANFLEEEGVTSYSPPKEKRQPLDRSGYHYSRLDDTKVHRYLTQLKECRTPSKTYSLTEYTLQEFDTFLEEIGCNPADFDDETIEQWLQTKKISPSKASTKRNVIRNCLIFLEANGVEVYVPATRLSLRNKECRNFNSWLSDYCYSYIELRLEKEEIKQSSAKAYRAAIKSFDTYLCENGYKELITKDMVDLWLATVKPENVVGYKSTIRGFLRYCRDKGVLLDGLESFLYPQKESKQLQSSLKEEFESYISFRKMSVQLSTLNADLFIIRSLDEYLVEIDFQGEYLSPELLYDWLERFDWITSTLNQRIVKVNLFLEYRAFLGKKVFYLPLKEAEETYIPYFFTEEDYARVYAAVDNYEEFTNGYSRFPYMAVELPMVIRLLDGTGMRIGEVVQLKVGDYDFSGSFFHIKKAKKRKERFVPVNNSLHVIIDLYCRAMGLLGNPNAYLFPRMDIDSHITDYDIRSRLKNIYKKLGITKTKVTIHEPGPCLHSFRHNFVLKAIRRLLSRGMNEEDIWAYLSTYLGHRSIKETEKYMKFRSELTDNETERWANYVANVFASDNEEEDDDEI